MAFSLTRFFSGLDTANPVGMGGSNDVMVGIDIGGSSIKVAVLEQTNETIVLQTYGELQLGPYAGKPLGEVVTLDTKQKISAINDVLREARATARKGVLVMPLSSSFLTVIPLQLTDASDDIANRLPVEAKKYVPLPLADVTLDWSELPSHKKVKTNSVVEIMLAAIENKALNEYQEILKAINMTGEPSEIEAFSAMRSLWRHDDTTLAILDLGARTSKLYIVRDETLERVHRVAIGGQTITSRLSELLNIQFEEAENLKRSYTRESEHARDIYKTMATVLDAPLSEFKHFITKYESRDDTPLQRVVITGGVAASPYMISYLKDRLSRDVEIGDAFAKVAYPAFMEDTLQTISPTFSVSLGAALRKFQYA